jgi:hypothetical protein
MVGGLVESESGKLWISPGYWGQHVFYICFGATKKLFNPFIMAVFSSISLNARYAITLLVTSVQFFISEDGDGNGSNRVLSVHGFYAICLLCPAVSGRRP